MLFQLKLFQRHAKGSSWYLGASCGHFLFFGPSRVFPDLNRAALHAIHELPEHGEFFRGHRAILGFLRQHFLYR